MDGTYVVLGIQWLKTLGKITTNYSELSMEFICDGKLVSWMGEGLIDDNALSAQELKVLKIVQHKTYLCLFRTVNDSLTEEDLEKQTLSEET